MFYLSKNEVNFYSQLSRTNQKVGLEVEKCENLAQTGTVVSIAGFITQHLRSPTRGMARLASHYFFLAHFLLS